eukprot:Awhi_evm1s3434
MLGKMTNTKSIRDNKSKIVKKKNNLKENTNQKSSTKKGGKKNKPVNNSKKINISETVSTTLLNGKRDPIRYESVIRTTIPTSPTNSRMIGQTSVNCNSDYDYLSYYQQNNPLAKRLNHQRINKDYQECKLHLSGRIPQKPFDLFSSGSVPPVLIGGDNKDKEKDGSKIGDSVIECLVKVSSLSSSPSLSKQLETANSCDIVLSSMTTNSKIKRTNKKKTTCNKRDDQKSSGVGRKNNDSEKENKDVNIRKNSTRKNNDNNYNSDISADLIHGKNTICKTKKVTFKRDNKASVSHSALDHSHFNFNNSNPNIDNDNKSNSDRNGDDANIGLDVNCTSTFYASKRPPNPIEDSSKCFSSSRKGDFFLNDLNPILNETLSSSMDEVYLIY